MAVTAPETDTPPAMADAEAAGRVLARFVATLESERYTGGDSIALVRLFTAVERTASAGKTLAARRVEEANLHRLTGHRSAAELLASSTGDSVGDTKGLLRLGHQLAHRPELDEAFRAGRLSRRRATQVAEAAGVNPTREHDLVDGAQVDTDATFKERCLRAQAEGRSRRDEARHHRHLHDQRSARTWTDGDGALCLHARLAPGPGAELQAALEAQADRQFGRARHDGRSETPDAYRADALVALVSGRGILGPGPGTTGPRAGPPATGRTPDPRASVSVVVDLESLRGGHVVRGGRCEIPGVGPVPVDHARDRLGDALVELLVAHGTDVTTVYSAGRHIPRRVRSALLLRDPRCVVPGCDARLGLENDHWVTDFARGGVTALDNLARLCHRHHQDRTHRGFTLRREGDTWVWVAPDKPVVPKRPKRPKRPERPERPERPGRRQRLGPGGTGKHPPPATGPPRFDQPPLRRQE